MPTFDGRKWAMVRNIWPRQNFGDFLVGILLKKLKMARKSGQMPTFKTKSGHKKVSVFNGFEASAHFAHLFCYLHGKNNNVIYIVYEKKWAKWAEGFLTKNCEKGEGQ